MEVPFAKQKAASPRGWNFTLLLRQRGNFTWDVKQRLIYGISMGIV